MIIAAAFVAPAVAQTTLPTAISPESRSRWLRDVEDSAGREAARHDEATKAKAEWRQREFTLLVADFAKSWNKLIETAGKGGWNTKDARKTRKAFERLVRCQAWIEENKALAGADPEAAEPAQPAPANTAQAK